MAKKEKRNRDAAAVDSAAAEVSQQANSGQQEVSVENEVIDETPDTTDTPDTDAPVVVGEDRPVYDPLSNPSYFSADQAEAIRAAVESGDVFTVPAKVTIRAQKSPTKKNEVQPFIAYYAATGVGMVVLSGGKEEPAKDAPEEGDDTRTPAEKQLGACDHFNYGFGLKMFQNPIRMILEDAIAGPEKAIAKSVKNLLDNKLFDTEEEAREFVISKRQAKGLAV